MNTRIIIDPACNFYYSSYYVKGLIELYGRRVSFRSKPFSHLQYSSLTHILSLLIIEANQIKRIVIDFSDAPDIDSNFLEWCDVYGKINYRASVVAGNKKIIPAAPNYAVKIWNKPLAGFIGLLNYIKCYNRTIPFHPFISKYLMTARRVSDFNDTKKTERPGYVFFVSTWWETQHLTNQSRANFIRACRSIPSLEFEGGLIPEHCKTINRDYEDVFIKNGISYKKYIEKIKQSIVVFNTPAYHLCHGWKLAEFLAMGKAIISTPLINELPEPLTHRENVYFVSEGEEDIKLAIVELNGNQQLREKLEKGALSYYNKYIEPQEAVKRILLK